MKQLQGAGILALAILAGACTNDGARPDDSTTTNKSSQLASLDREPPAFAAFVPPPQKAAALAAWREASFGLYYSQSQDWSHPGGQKNTWDFPWQPEGEWWAPMEEVFHHD